MCNLYSVTKSQDAIRQLFRVTRDMTGNLPPLPDIFPDQLAPIVRKSRDGERERTIMRRGAQQAYLANAYRVLLTRARQGMVIFIPQGDHSDATRLPSYYDETYQFLLGAGARKLEQTEMPLDDFATQKSTSVR
jgi:hypothetical protein